ncbi:MAG: hypothetical protein HFJ28_01040 [Clostridia bacterium]|jgi:hypothetical protein|nr:hypothetical protein [Clostridia bacterium]
MNCNQTPWTPGFPTKEATFKIRVDSAQPAGPYSSPAISSGVSKKSSFSIKKKGKKQGRRDSSNKGL